MLYTLDLRRKLIEYNDAHATIQTKLLTEIISIKRIITEKTTGAVERPSALPRAAFSQKEDFLLFEEEVKNNAEKFKIIVRKINIHTLFVFKINSCVFFRKMKCM